MLAFMVVGGMELKGIVCVCGGVWMCSGVNYRTVGLNSYKGRGWGWVGITVG